jgi:hypothetical protein
MAQASFSGTNFASLGLIDMPSARMDPDGALSFDANYFLNNQRYDLGFQAAPWLNVRLEYSGLDHLEPRYPVYWDRSFGVKIRLSNETSVLPEVSMGATDLIGTGLFSGEYLVASKQFGSLDTTLGLGWGSLGSTDTFRNPLGLIFPSFKNRTTGFQPSGGTDFGELFHGASVGLFGGVTWHTPIDGLSLTAEYSSDAYTLQRQQGNFTPLSQVNYALTYALNNTTEFSFAWLYGRSFGGEISFEMDPTGDSFPTRIGAPPPPAPSPRSPEQQQEALAAILGQRGKKVAVPPEQFRSNGQLVDALWHQNDDLVDVTVEGRNLTLVIARGNVAEICRFAARTVGLYSLSITKVGVSDGARIFNCPVATSPAIALLGPNVGDRLETIALSPAPFPAAYVTIDAAGEPRSDVEAAITRIRDDLKKQQITVDAVNISGAELVIYYTNSTYFAEANAIDRLVRILMADAPSEIEKFRLIAVIGSIPQREFDVLRAPTERSFAQDRKLVFADSVSSGSSPMQNPVLSAADRGSYPKFSWDVFPQFRQELFDPSDPLGLQFVAAASGTAELLPGLSLNGEIEGNIWDNFNTNRSSNSVLPHVRTDFVRYFTEGKNGIGDLEGDYNFRLTPNVFGVVRAGYLESMFVGAGGEVLWRPENQRWAIGGDLYEVQQRDFDRLFGLQSYHALTGHISLYYASPWYGFNFVVRAGQYLAQDRGVTFEVSRRFSTGVEIGAFMTKTNVSAAQFGEGSFDKGITIRIPIGWVAPIDTQSELATTIRPVQRDGGQRLMGDAILYDYTRRPSEDEIVSTLGANGVPDGHW